jgi:hypothetical protein
MTSTLKRGRANTQGDAITFSPETLERHLEALRIEAESTFVTNPNLDPFSVIQDGCEEADESAYPDDSKHACSPTFEPHSFQSDFPKLFINTPPGRRE